MTDLLLAAGPWFLGLALMLAAVLIGAALYGGGRR